MGREEAGKGIIADIVIIVATPSTKLLASQYLFSSMMVRNDRVLSWFVFFGPTMLIGKTLFYLLMFEKINQQKKNITILKYLLLLYTIIRCILLRN